MRKGLKAESLSKDNWTFSAVYLLFFSVRGLSLLRTWLLASAEQQLKPLDADLEFLETEADRVKVEASEEAACVADGIESLRSLTT